MKAAMWNAPLMAVGGALMGASAASYQVTSEWTGSPAS